LWIEAIHWQYVFVEYFGNEGSPSSYLAHITIVAAPEPTTLGLTGVAFGVLVVLRRKSVGPYSTPRKGLG
jgi:hypothetical protein